MDNRKISSQNNVHPGRYLGVDENGDCIYSDARALSLFELMRIMSLPDDWALPLNTNEAFVRSVIGEGIPPLFIKKLFVCFFVFSVTNKIVVPNVLNYLILLVSSVFKKRCKDRLFRPFFLFLCIISHA